MKAAGNRPLKLTELMKRLYLDPSERKTVRRLLRELEAEGDLAKVRGHTYMSGEASQVVTGRLRVNRRGFGFVIPPPESPEAEQGDVFVSQKGLADAMTGDLVKVRVMPAQRGRGLATGMKREGRIIEVVERGTLQIAGTYYGSKRGGTVVPHDPSIGRSINVPRPAPEMGVEDGAFVLVLISVWTHPPDPLLGKIVELLGYPDDRGIDITLIVRNAGVEPDFPEEVLEQAEAIDEAIPEPEIARRTDFRKLVTFTMDGATAKDFDDALSIERVSDNVVRLGVHIADVSHYVTENSPLDLEGRERGTSIYPVDRVVPMLPEKLSNNVCSLRPEVDRLTMSCIMDIDDEGHVRRYSVHESVIRSSFRLIYEEVQAVMEGKAEPAQARRLGPIMAQLEELYKLRKVLTKMRLDRGALDLDIPETEVVFDEKGEVRDIARRERLESHRVVEECMLIANEVVSAHLFNLKIPSVYRVHEDPDLEKLRRLQPALSHLGVRFPAKKEIGAESIQQALSQTEQTPAGAIARRLILRSMMRARYHYENLGHFGLASVCYTHFTSPIRRYPDLLVHRLLRETLQNGAPDHGKYRPPMFGGGDSNVVEDEDEELSKHLPPERHRYWNAQLPTMMRHTSERERRAEEIENDAKAAKAAEFMRKFIGHEFEGMITSITSWGFFVELNRYPVEGLIHIRKLTSDYFEYDEEHMRLTGRETGIVFKLGDKVLVMLENANPMTQEIDFDFIERIDAGENAARTAGINRRRLEKERRHEGRRPEHKGFQARGRAKKRGRR